MSRYNSADDDNFTQAGIFYRKVLNDEDRQHLVENIANHLVNAQDFLQERAIGNFTQACPEYGASVRKALEKVKTQLSKASAAKL
ncbi:hypothetical protein CGJ15_24785 [Vibrio parahaemolyticus]|nr:hypothetical protein CGJ15_24785 [Vibrio parahaemolyticus]